MSDSSGERYVIEARLLGVDESCANKKRQRKSVSCQLSEDCILEDSRRVEPLYSGSTAFSIKSRTLTIIDRSNGTYT
jgi:hypothetical protein